MKIFLNSCEKEDRLYEPAIKIVIEIFEFIAIGGMVLEQKKLCLAGRMLAAPFRGYTWTPGYSKSRSHGWHWKHEHQE